MPSREDCVLTALQKRGLVRNKQKREKERERSSDNTAGLSLFIQKWSNKKVEPSGCRWHDSTRTGRTKRCCKLMENKSANEQKPLMNHLCFAGWSLYVYRDIRGDGYGWLAFYFLTLCRPRKPHGSRLWGGARFTRGQVGAQLCYSETKLTAEESKGNRGDFHTWRLYSFRRIMDRIFPL